MPIMTQAAFNEMPAWLQDIYEKISFQVAREFSEIFPGAPDKNPNIGYAQQNYPGQRLADIPPDLLRSHGIGRKTESYVPYLQSSKATIERARHPFTKHYKEYMNPYEKEVIRQIEEEGNRQLKETIIPEIEGRFIKLGQHGSKRHAGLVSKAIGDTSKEILNRKAAALMQGYENSGKLFNADSARLLEASGQMASLGGLTQAGRMADMTALSDQGRYLQQQQQVGLDLQYQDFLRHKDEPWEALGKTTASLAGMPYNTSQTSYYQTPGTPQLNVMGQLGQLAGNMYGARMAMGTR